MPITHVADYLIAKLPTARSERLSDLADFPVDSSCGFQCTQAIDAAYDLIMHINHAVGCDHAVAELIISHAVIVVEVYAFG